MPENEETKQTIQKNLLQELRELQAVLDAETVDAIPVLSDVVTDYSADEAATAAQGSDAKTPNDDSNIEDSGIPQLDDRIAPSDADVADSLARQSSAAPEPPLITEKAAPFALVDSNSEAYDSSTAESLIAEGLHEALTPLTEQMDDEALRLVDELVAEHAELIRQQLKLKLAVKSEALQAGRDIVRP